MLFIKESLIQPYLTRWNELVEVIRGVIPILLKGTYSQPIKPYIRFQDPANRIIAMPASLASPFDVAGIKWIASFPQNILSSLPRAHSLTILNSSSTGEPLAILESSLLSGVRTAAVSGLVINSFLQAFPNRKLRIGIVGFGIIGQLHLQMLKAFIPDQLKEIVIFDSRSDHLQELCQEFQFLPAKTWTEAYEDADLFITCTTTNQPYIDLHPKNGSLHLNISLRDYFPEILRNCKHIIVDNWEEVCREGTDINRAYVKYQLQKEDTLSLQDVVSSNYFSRLDKKKFLEKEYAIFNPMGMAVFDIALAKHIYDKVNAEDLATTKGFEDE